jgi:cell filamentation protein
MKKDGRYDVSGLTEAQFEPGSNEQVLKNLRGIKSSEEMDRVEALELTRAVDQLVREYDEAHCFTASDICYFHKIWLEGVYEWAGEYRRVNVTKDDFSFAAAAQVPKLMDQFEAGPLRRYTPCRFEHRQDIVHALAETHTELVLIHPFREGNGRAARILSILMALQAGLPLLNFSLIAEQKRDEYFAAVRAGLDRDYRLMEAILSEVIERTLLEA